MAEKYISEPVFLPPATALHENPRWAIAVEGVNQLGPSFEGRVYVGPAEQEDPSESEDNYAGSFHVYGYGLPPQPNADRLPLTLEVDVTDRLKKLAQEGKRTGKIVVRPVVAGRVEGQFGGIEDHLGINGVEIKPISN